MALKPDYNSLPEGGAVDPLFEIRKRAFEQAAQTEWGQSDPPHPDQAQALLEDLRIHQIELELQNEELRRVQADLENSRARYFDLYNLAPVGYLTVGLDGFVTEANLRAATLLGVPRTSLFRRKFERFIAAGCQESFHFARTHLDQTGKPQSCEVRMLQPNGSPLWVRLELILSEENGAEVCRMVVIDITGRKRLEEELRESNLRLTLEKTVAEDATRAKSRFLSSMTHEIRTPLNGVVGMADLLMQTELSAEQRGYAEIVAQSADSLLGLVNNILDFSKIEAGRLEFDEKPFNLESLLEDVVNAMAPKAREKSLDLVFQFAAAAPRYFVADAGRIRQIVTNFLSNAIKFTDAGRVQLEAASLSATNELCHIRLSVHDTGIGISKVNLHSLFTPFVQANPTIATRYGGTGLGLAIVKEIVTAMGGEIVVHTEENRGSTFSCLLPLRLHRHQEEVVAPVAKPAALGRCRVLVTDDNLINQKLTCALLSRLGCDVDTALDGAEAVSKVGQTDYGLVLMDCFMPGMDGFDATVAIRALAGKCSKVPIVALTASATREDRDHCFASGMNDFLTKPLRSDELASCLAKWFKN